MMTRHITRHKTELINYPFTANEFRVLNSLITGHSNASQSINRLQHQDYLDLFAFVQASVGHFDQSHNEEHAVQVWQNTMRIALSLAEPFAEDILSYSSMLHDVCDHKYPDSIPKDQLENFIMGKIGKGKGQKVLEIIDNISFSKERAGNRKMLSPPFDLYLTVVSDADRLEAIGSKGIERCEQFTIARGGKVPEEVIQHCHDKLLRLYSDHYIKIPLAREFAWPLHQELVDYVNSHQNESEVCL